uniref:Methyltranfer_dom domain-containing protein n=1 Tax=Glossina brevipalpis TaxID=37001 RepID=A0A1A9WV49_9MUSC
MAIANLRTRLDAILTFMEPYWEWVNCHMVNFLTDNIWETYVPESLQNEVLDASHVASCIETIFWSGSVKKSSLEYPECFKFVKQTQQHSLSTFDDILISLDRFQEINNIVYQQINIKEFMSCKKKHEVELTVNLINGLLKSKPKEEVVVIDAGDGKGYLSSHLALEYGYKVLGIDSNQSNTESALERNRKLEKAWIGLKARAELEVKNLRVMSRKEKQKRGKETYPGKISSNYKTTSRFITKDLDLSHLVKENFPDMNRGVSICLTGLHTCGNLASSCLRVYQTQAECKFLCNIGCCYHLLKERYSNRERFANVEIMCQQDEPGFPMSQYLQEKQTKLGRNARMLAAQSLERVLAAREMPNPSLFYRALLEVVIRESDLQFKENVQIGKIRNYRNFEEYAAECLKKYPFLPIKAEKVKYLQEKYQHSCQYLELFYMLRLCFSPILESVILLDRLLYLHELNYTQSYLISLFDPIISPRHYAIISIK